MPRPLSFAVEDLTDDRVARQELEHWYRAAPVGICLIDRELRFVRVNERMARVNGIAPGQHVGRSIREVTPRFASVAERACRQVLDGGGAIDDLEVDGLPSEPADPERRWRASLEPVRDDGGEIIAVSVMVREITDLGAAQHHLRVREQQLRLMADSFPALIAYVDRDQRYVFNNATYSDWFGLDHAQLVGHHISEALGPTYEKLRDKVEAALSGQRLSFESTLPRVDGGERFTQVSVIPHESNGEVLGYFLLATDITEHKRTEAALREALREIAELKDRLEAENVYLRREAQRSHEFHEIVGESPSLHEVLDQARQIAATTSTVLLLGETGTGKELLARAIHRHSARHDGPLVKVNCAALPPSLIESELFGHERGAFTGALARKIGRFELADGGTIFLDEIGDLAPEVQTKLLRVLQEGEFERVGSTRTQRVDVRVIAATHRCLASEMEAGRFRPDLYYRLSVFPIRIPPLRERRDDIPHLVWHFVSKFQEELGKTIDRIPASVMEALLNHDWPGNVRELQNVIERAMVLAHGNTLLIDQSYLATAPQPAGPTFPKPTRGRATRLDQVERAHIIEVLERCGWKVKGRGNAAETLGMNPSTLRHRMRKLGIQRPETTSSVHARP